VVEVSTPTIVVLATSGEMVAVEGILVPIVDLTIYLLVEEDEDGVKTQDIIQDMAEGWALQQNSHLQNPAQKTRPCRTFDMLPGLY
jgi:hypothetical protein